MKTPTPPSGEAINEAILEAGIIALVPLGGDHIYFYPRNTLPPYLWAYLDLSMERRCLLRDYLMGLGNASRYR